MSYPVRYHCPHCGTIVELERTGYLEDKAVTPYPFEGWQYLRPDEPFEDADGVVVTCGKDGLAVGDRVDIDRVAYTSVEQLDEGAAGCGRQFYLSFVRFEDGEEIEPRPPTERIELAGPGPRSPQGPRGPEPWR